MRPPWDEYFIGVAVAVAARGDCTRSQVGAVLVEDRAHRILSTGYNGVEPGRPGCLDGHCPRGLLSVEDYPPGGNYDNCISKHAEENTIEWWDGYYSYYDWCTTIYITRKPCLQRCIPLLREYRVGRAVFLEKTVIKEWYGPPSYILGRIDLNQGG